MTREEAIREGASRLEAAGCPEPRADAEVLLAHLLRIERAPMILDRRLPLEKRDAEAYRRRIARRARREPVAYITGEREFWSLPFRVTRSVLIPRPDTETLVQEGLELLGKAGFHDGAPRGGADQAARVIDVGTGSGCVAVALAHANRRAQLLAIDRSARALRVAAHNVERQGLAGRVTLRRGDLLGEPGGARGAGKSGRVAPAHLILSNPPYVEDGDWEKLPPDIRDWEPASALRGGPDGLAIHRRLRADAPAHLLPGGSIAVEVGAGQAAAVSALYEAGGDFEGIRVVADLAGIPRVVSARRR